MRKVEHPQVDFKNYFGDTVQVDVGIVTVLMLLSRQGVQTDYSCQGTKEQSAYISMKTRTCIPLIRKILLRMLFRRYSFSSSLFIKHLRGGFRQYEVHWYRDESTDLSLSFSMGYDAPYSIEYSYSRPYGLRTIIRFPPSQISVLRNLLNETQSIRRM